MEESNLWSVLITLITVLGGTSAFRYYERRAMHKEKDEDFIRNDCKDRIAKLEALLAESSREKEEMRSLILNLTSQVAELKTKVEFLTKENNKLTGKRTLND
jgi:hypothetical protein